MNLDDRGLYYGTLGKRVGIFSARENTEAKASFFFASGPLEYDRRNIVRPQQILADKCARDQWQIPRLLQMMDESPDFYFDSISQIRMERWSAGRSVLLGDAAHCASPLAGMGTSMAVVGAHILAGELKEANGDHTVAFARYETLMRD